jgi:hypothetical protein
MVRLPIANTVTDLSLGGATTPWKLVLELSG